MTKKNRNLTVYGMTKGPQFQSIPQIRLQGDWLRASGFSIGDNIQVICKKNRLIITKEPKSAS